MKSTTIYLDETDRKAIEAIRAAYGCGSDAAAVRLAIRTLARGVDRMPGGLHFPPEIIDLNPGGKRNPSGGG
jgi:hypothetical protein